MGVACIGYQFFFLELHTYKWMAAAGLTFITHTLFPSHTHAQTHAHIDAWQ